MIKEELWFLVIPILMAVLVLLYFIYHIKHASKYSDLILSSIFDKIKLLESKQGRIRRRLKVLIELFENLTKTKKKLSIFDFERELGIDMMSFEQKLDQELKRVISNAGEANMQENDLKKEIFTKLALSVFGNLIGQSKEGEILTKTMYFVSNPDGHFFFLARDNNELCKLDLDKDIVFSVVKEEELVSEMAEINIKGKVFLLDADLGEWQEGLSLFEEKSPYIKNIPWVDDQKKYKMYSLKPQSISYQTVKNEREGKQAFMLIKEGE